VILISDICGLFFKMGKNKLLNWGIFLLLTFIWGSSFILMKYSKEHLTAAQLAALRIFSAALVFAPFTIAHLRKFPPNKILVTIVSGITGNLLPAFLYAKAISQNIDSSLASILNSLTPLFVVIIAVIVFKDRIGRQKIIGVLVGFIGLTMLFMSWKGISFENFKYASLILVATISYGINVNIVGHFLKTENPVQISSISIGFMIFPTAFVLWRENFFSLPFGDVVIQKAIGEAVFLGIAGTAIATALFYVLIKRAGGLFASLVTYSIPIVGTFWGSLDGEQIGYMQLLCMAVILFGVWLANRRQE
jgi:drug/metabolite transporter (DMT)-like permease